MGYEFRRESKATFIIAHPACEELPKIWAKVRKNGPNNSEITVWYGEDEALLATAIVCRGAAFAERVARYMLKGALSRLGRHRRLSANRQKRLSAEAEGAAE